MYGLPAQTYHNNLPLFNDGCVIRVLMRVDMFRTTDSVIDVALSMHGYEEVNSESFEDRNISCGFVGRSKCISNSAHFPTKWSGRGRR